jgi:formylglycine-generating enzyme required for sulfatase activity
MMISIRYWLLFALGGRLFSWHPLTLGVFLIHSMTAVSAMSVDSLILPSSSDEGEFASGDYLEEVNYVDNEDEFEPHPDPNLEHYDGMIYVGRIDETTGRRLSADYDHLVKFVFGTSLNMTTEGDDNELSDTLVSTWHHLQTIPEEDLQHDPYGPHDQNNQLTRRKKDGTGIEVTADEETRWKKLHKPVNVKEGPKPYGHVHTHPLDGGVYPPHVVRIDPFFLDQAPVTNKQFAKFVASTYYETEAEKFGWSFVLESFVPQIHQSHTQNHIDSPHGSHHSFESDPEAEHWVTVPGAHWRQPEGPGSSYQHRLHHPVVHVSHRDAAEYCQWMGKRLPGEREYEAAARGRHIGPRNRTVYTWEVLDGNQDNHVNASDWTVAARYANLWGAGTFPHVNHGEDGWRGTSPVQTYPPNELGFYDLIGNVWEWTRGGKHTQRVVRGASYVDTLDGSVNHAATVSARATLHGTTTTGNVGFRCAVSPRRRVEHDWHWHHDKGEQSPLAMEDAQGRKRTIASSSYDPAEVDPNDEWLDEDGEKWKKKKVVKRRERLSTEL